MLDLNAMLFQRIFFICLFFLVGSTRPPLEGLSSGGQIRAPLGGEALQGSIAVEGSTGENIQSAELSYAYEDGNDWFLLFQTSTPVDGVFSWWDTTLISDGDYQLRLVVIYKDGVQTETIVHGLRVRNYSLVETATPALQTETPQMTEMAATPTATPTPAPVFTATAMPANPLTIHYDDLRKSAATGVFIAGIVIGLLVIFARFSAWLRGR